MPVISTKELTFSYELSGGNVVFPSDESKWSVIQVILEETRL